MNSGVNVLLTIATEKPRAQAISASATLALLSRWAASPGTTYTSGARPGCSR
jgi:hypothetical protein